MSQIVMGKQINLKLATRMVVITTLVMAVLLAAFTPGSAAGIPVTSIVSVNPNVSVTISGVNFPADQSFTVRMGSFRHSWDRWDCCGHQGTLFQHLLHRHL